MAEFDLIAKPPLGGLDKTWGQTRLREVTDLAIVAVSVPQDGAGALEKAMKAAWGCGVVPPGQSHLSGDMRVIGWADAQVLVCWPGGPQGAVDTVRSTLGDAGYLVDQTSNLVTLELDGPLARDALERLTALNLKPAVFGVGAAQRTVMEHMGAAVVRVGEDAFWLMSANSSAPSFAHAVETSLDWVS